MARANPLKATLDGISVADFSNNLAGPYAAMILDGYSRHEFTDQGVWLIRNYFGYAQRNFASNSYLVDYDADFVRLVADGRIAAEAAMEAASEPHDLELMLKSTGVVEASLALSR